MENDSIAIVGDLEMSATVLSSSFADALSDILSDYAKESDLLGYAMLSDIDGSYLPLSGGIVSGDMQISSSSLSISDGQLNVHGSIVGGSNPSANAISGYGSFAFGNNVSALSDYAFAEGTSTFAYGYASHAECRQTSAIGDYSHAEGSKTIAYGEKAHAEGGGTYAYSEMTHAEGEMCSALWRGGHAEGKVTKAYMYAHAEGVSSVAGYDLNEANAFVQGDTASHAEGFQTSAIAKYSHAEGYQTLAGILDLNQRPIIADDQAFNGEKDFRIDQAAHAEGAFTSSFGYASHAEGRSTIANGDQSHAGGKDSCVDGNNSFVHGLSCFIDKNSSESFAFGFGNNIYGNGSKMFAIGSHNTISATGDADNVFVGGLSNTIDLGANGPSFIYGRKNRLTNSGLNFVAGENLSCNHNYSILLGTSTESKAQRQFVWSGTSNKYVPSALSGTFNIDPANGINGFYIGKDNFISCVAKALELAQSNEALSTAMKNAIAAYL